MTLSDETVQGLKFGVLFLLALTVHAIACSVFGETIVVDVEWHAICIATGIFTVSLIRWLIRG